jgi:hypothetical protein
VVKKGSLDDASHLDKCEHYQIMFLERHGMDDIYTIKSDGTKVTKLEEIKAGIAKYGRWSGRKDIVMINQWLGKGYSNCGEQWTLDPHYQDRDMEREPIWKMLNKAQRAEAKRLRNLCVEAETVYGLPRGTLLCSWTS